MNQYEEKNVMKQIERKNLDDMIYEMNFHEHKGKGKGNKQPALKALP